MGLFIIIYFIIVIVKHVIIQFSHSYMMID